MLVCLDNIDDIGRYNWAAAVTEMTLHKFEDFVTVVREKRYSRNTTAKRRIAGGEHGSAFIFGCSATLPCTTKAMPEKATESGREKGRKLEDKIGMGIEELESGGKILETPVGPEGIGEEGGRNALKEEKNTAGTEGRKEKACREGPERRVRSVGRKMEMCHVGHRMETCRVGHKKEMCHVGHEGETCQAWHNGKMCHEGHGRESKEYNKRRDARCTRMDRSRLGFDVLTPRYFLINFAQRADGLALLLGIERLS
ncbi:hypothetical protein Taro_030405 [Colocasia esculenta]|uniref:Uncharacterized protein n=1 Tax=Colocasia esculenta TaxID=4460 RepID=A0A843VMC9_COLES|nr:hypothetical protein [Colocasia esculenta]